jgi:hypothetical protein
MNTDDILANIDPNLNINLAIGENSHAGSNHVHISSEDPDFKERMDNFFKEVNKPKQTNKNNIAIGKGSSAGDNIIKIDLRKKK